MHPILSRKEQYRMEFMPYVKYFQKNSNKKDQKLMPELVPKINK